MPSMIDGIGTVSSFKKAQQTAAQKAYETRTGDRGNVVPSYVAPVATTQPAALSTQTAPILQQAPILQEAPVVRTAPVVQTAPAPAPAPAPADAAEATGTPEGESDALAKFTEEDIAAALAEIEAEFGLTQAELMADQTMVGAQYRLLYAQLGRQRERALQGAEAGALQRGLFHSGIYAQEVGEISGEYAEARAQYLKDQQAKEAAIASQLATMPAEMAAQKAAEEQAIRRGEYTARLQAAGL